MPWLDPKQRTAIFLQKKRKLGEAGARRWMHEHGHGGRNGKSARARAAKRRLAKHSGRR